MYVCSSSSAKRCTNSSRCGGVRCCQCGPSARRAVSCTSKTSVAIFRTAARRSGFLSSALSEGSSRTLRTASVYSRTWSVGAPARTGAAAHATRLRAMAATTDDRIIRRILPAQYTVRGGPGGPRLTDDRLQVGEDFALELVEALAEDVAEVAVPVLAALERLEVVDHARKAVALDQVIRHQERQLIGRQRAFLEVAHREAARVAERLEIQLGGHERRVVADPGGGEPAPVGQRVEAEALERREGHPLGHALGQPLLGAPLALRHLDLRDVRELVRDETQPLAAARLRAVVVEQELAALADADRELRELGGARRRDLRVVHETVLERLAPAIHVEREGRGHRQPQLADQDRRQPAHGGFVVAERARVARDRDGGGIDGEWNHNAAGATGCDDDQRQQRGDAKAAVGNPFHTPRHFHTPARSKGRTFPSWGCETYNATPSHGCAAGWRRSGSDADVLGADPEADEPPRQAAEPGEARQQPHRRWGPQGTPALQHAPHDPVLDEHLDPLGHARGPLAAALHAREILGAHPSLAQRRRQQVGGGHRVLDREVDADAADGRHRVRGVAEAEHARPEPAREPVHAHGEQLHVLPVAQRARLGARVGEPRDLIAERREAAGADLVERALGDHETALPVVAAVEHDEDPPGLHAAEQLARVARLPWQPEPQHVHGRAERLHAEPGRRADRGVAAVGADDEVGADLVHDLEGGGMDRVAAEVAQEVGVLLQHDHVDAGARQEQAEHHPGRAAAGDAAACRERPHATPRRARPSLLRAITFSGPAGGPAAAIIMLAPWRPRCRQQISTSGGARPSSTASWPTWRWGSVRPSSCCTATRPRPISGAT